METFTPTDSALAHDALPQVTFDISLGKRGYEVDFNYGALFDSLSAKGLTVEQISETLAHFERRDSLVNLVFGGSASPETGEVTVVVPRFIRSSKRLNRALEHELQHRADYATGAVGEFGKTMTKIRNITLASAFCGMGSTSLCVAVDRITGGHDLYQATNYSLYTSIGLYASYLIGFFGLSKFERRARKSARSNVYEFISFKK